MAQPWASLSFGAEVRGYRGRKVSDSLSRLPLTVLNGYFLKVTTLVVSRASL